MSSRAGMGELESAIMNVLWSADVPLSVRDVMGGLTDREPAYTTVMTVLDRLAKKGMALRELDGRAWRYTAATSREAMTATMMRTSLSSLQGPQRKAALLHFLDEASPEEIADLRSALDDLD